MTPSDPSQLGRVLLVAGAALMAAGLLLVVAGKIPGLGRLPGDFMIERPGFTFYFPLATSLVVSALLTLLFWLFRR